MLQDIKLLTIDLSMFGEAPAAGEGSAPAAAESTAPAEVRYGKQAETAAAPQQTTQNPAPDKGKTFREMIRGEYRDQYADETQKLINRRFRDTDAKIQSMQPIIDALDARYGTNGDMTKLMAAIDGDAAYWQEAADAAGMTVEQYQRIAKVERQNRQLLKEKEAQQTQYFANLQYSKWLTEAQETMGEYPDFDLADALENDKFAVLLRNGFPLKECYEDAFSKHIAAQAAARAEKAVTDNIRARGTRPTEAGTNSTPPFAVKDDVSKLTDEDVKNILKQIGNGGKISFG